MIEFIKFLRLKKLVSAEDLTAAEVSLSNMKRNLRNRVGIQRSQNVDEDSRIVVSGSDIANFYSSSRCKAAQDLLKKAECPNPCAKRKVTNMRNYLIANIIIDNYARPAALYSMSVTSVMKAKVSANRVSQKEFITLH